VFPQREFAAMNRAYDELLSGSEEQEPGAPRFGRSNASYDPLTLPLDSDRAGSFAALFNAPWLHALAHLIGVPESPWVDAGLHFCPQGSRSGWIHTDYCIGWFDRDGGETRGLRWPDRTRCSYFTGVAKSGRVAAVAYARVASAILYLENPGWTESDGGETGLYSASEDSLGTEQVRVPPVGNTLLAFECGPHSYHRFLANPGRARRSIVLWLHSTPESATKRWNGRAPRRIPR